jgi:L-seryl-tRNA(Ser) seleniumtransferase
VRLSAELYRRLPGVDALLADPLLADIPRSVLVYTARGLLDELRSSIRSGELTELGDVVGMLRRRCLVFTEGRLRGVINATGVVVHTNLGRAPWPAPAVEAAVRATRYCNLEMDLESGKRGGRLSGVSALLGLLTGCEDALVVNNCAASVLLALTSLAYGREVVVSRGELVEIGGSFRVPDVIASGGALLRDVGATNRARISDFADAVGENTAVLLRVHRSNFKIVGFTADVPRSELVALASEKGLMVVEDLGSGSLTGTHGEPSVREAVSEGVDVVLFSGDKLFGGPQAGIAVGKRDVIARMRKHPLYRALRVDKVILAALESTLVEHAAGRTTPVQEMLDTPAERLQERAAELARLLGERAVEAHVQPSIGWFGGGAMPGVELPSVAVTVPRAGAGVARRLRTGSQPVVARVADDALWLDARTLMDEELVLVADAVAAACDRGMAGDSQ